jgi:hypothetical protein
MIMYQHIIINNNNKHQTYIHHHQTLLLVECIVDCGAACVCAYCNTAPERDAIVFFSITVCLLLLRVMHLTIYRHCCPPVMRVGFQHSKTCSGSFASSCRSLLLNLTRKRTRKRTARQQCYRNALQQESKALYMVVFGATAIRDNSCLVGSRKTL